ncbi:ROK family protein, partial [Nonomuraea rhizosphaerae]|uniref:ROK family protein n=1 Tax=Nonomuraea rhizosphaerae TaxID=2665663 RepID=UPI001C5EA8AE
MAVDVGGTTLKGGLIGRDGTVLYTERRPTPRADGPEAVITAIAAFITDLSEPRARSDASTGASDADSLRPGDTAQSEDSLRPVAIGLAVPGLVTSTHAVFASAFGWRDVPAEAFTQVNLPMMLGHDVRSAGEAELAYGPEGADGDRPGDVLYLPIGTGIAGAVVLAGALYGGTAGWAGQIGHIPVFPDGLPCNCGQHGCLGAYASASAIAARCGEVS